MTTNAIAPTLEHCLAYQVLIQPESWIADPSVKYLQAFLAGVSMRASLMSPDFPEWRISGVLEQQDFVLPIVAKTGHPSLTIRWAGAIEMLCFSQADGFAVLLSEFRAWHGAYGFSMDRVGNLPWSPEDFWIAFAKRPGMYMGSNDGWCLYCFLNGMHAGGNWLGLPQMPGVDKVFGDLKQHSEFLYGSTFATFRVHDAEHLLAHAGVREL